MREKLKVGDRLWLVKRPGGRNLAQSEVIVTKIGRKWAQIANAERPTYAEPRIDVETLVCDGGNFTSPGRCYRSKDEYEAIVNLDSAWQQLQGAVRDAWHRPAHLTLADILQINALLSARQETRHGE